MYDDHDKLAITAFGCAIALYLVYFLAIMALIGTVVYVLLHLVH